MLWGACVSICYFKSDDDEVDMWDCITVLLFFVLATQTMLDLSFKKYLCGFEPDGHAEKSTPDTRTHAGTHKFIKTPLHVLVNGKCEKELCKIIAPDYYIWEYSMQEVETSKQLVSN